MIRCWVDSWCDSQPLAQKFPDIFTLSLKKDAVIADCWCTSSQTWDLGLRRCVFDRVRGNGCDFASFKCLGASGWV